MIGVALERWLAYAVHEKRIRKPPERADTSRGPARDYRYRAWIRTLPCAACGKENGIEASHTGPHGFNQKASDYTCIPLCLKHHRIGARALDRIGRRRFEYEFDLSISQLVLRLNRIWFETKKLPA